jgi:hypothetical protein
MQNHIWQRLMHGWKKKGVGIGAIVKEFKDVFAWTYRDLKGIPLELT